MDVAALEAAAAGVAAEEAAVVRARARAARAVDRFSQGRSSHGRTAALCEAVLLVAAQLSDRELGRLMSVDDKTVAKYRRKFRTQIGGLERMDKRFVVDAREADRHNMTVLELLESRRAERVRRAPVVLDPPTAGRAVWAATPDDRDQHFVGWEDELPDVEQLFQEGAIWAVVIRRENLDAHAKESNPVSDTGFEEAA